MECGYWWYYNNIIYETTIVIISYNLDTSLQIENICFRCLKTNEIYKTTINNNIKYTIVSLDSRVVTKITH